MFDYKNPFSAPSGRPNDRQAGVSKGSFVRALRKVGEKLFGFEKDLNDLQQRVTHLEAVVLAKSVQAELDKRTNEQEVERQLESKRLKREAVNQQINDYTQQGVDVGVIRMGDDTIPVPWNEDRSGAIVHRQLYGDHASGTFEVFPEPLTFAGGNDEETVQALRKMVHADLTIGMLAAVEAGDETLKTETSQQLNAFAADLEGEN